MGGPRAGSGTEGVQLFPLCDSMKIQHDPPNLSLFQLQGDISNIVNPFGRKVLGEGRDSGGPRKKTTAEHRLKTDRQCGGEWTSQGSWVLGSVLPLIHCNTLARIRVTPHPPFP